MPPPGYDTQDTAQSSAEDDGSGAITEKDALDAVLFGDTDRARALVAELSDEKCSALDHALWQFQQVVQAVRSERRNQETTRAH